MNSQDGQNLVQSEDIRRSLEQAEEPLTSAQLSKILKQKSGKALKPVLDAEVHAERIYSWGSNQYWSKNPRAMARERLLSVAKSEVLAADPLTKRATADSPKI